MRCNPSKREYWLRSLVHLTISPREMAGCITHGWMCFQNLESMEAALVPVFKRWANKVNFY